MLIFDLKIIGRNIQDIRERKSMKRMEIAEKANISERTYADIERGSTKMRIDTLLNVCQALEITPNEFLTRDDKNITYEDITSKLNICTDKQKDTALKLLESYLKSL